MATQSASKEIMIAAPKLMHFTTKTTCPACGVRSFRPWLNHVRALTGAAPLCTYDVHYCQGSKPPTERSDIPAAIAEMLGVPDKVHNCAGIYEPHLHLRCLNCGLKRLMKTSTQIEVVG